MAVITQENRDAWQALGSSLSENNPLHKRVRVVRGRKHKGACGVMIRQMRDAFYDWKYVSEASEMYKEMEGREGYVGLIEDEETQKTFWVKCAYLEILD